jgi:23S rRNA (cytosine1962-C5)-methyltransferase
VSEKLPIVTLQPKEDRRMLRGHAWAYRNEFKQLPDLADGALVDVYSAERRFVARGFYQARGGIGVRLLTRRQENIDRDFFVARLRQARQLRERLFPSSDVYRWVFGESDGLPGLVVDRYGSVVSAETTCMFYQQNRDLLVELLLAESGVEGVLLNVNNAQSREGVVPDFAEVDLEGVSVRFSLERPQKTGLFLDQRLNRKAIEAWAGGARVLDAHCHVGLWSVHAARAGAAHVHGVDTAAGAIASAQENAVRNGVQDRCTFECADVDDVLRREAQYDVIVLDPPAFAKARDHQRAALTRYQALNQSALAAVAPGGILITASCSHFVDEAAFLDMIKRAGGGAGRTLQLLELRGAAPDHPVLMTMPETRYLKCAILRVL